MNATICFDMYGCPNRCRHCWLGHEKNKSMNAENYTWIADQFKNYEVNGQKYFSELIFSSWFREPDYGNDYKELWKLDHELSTVKPTKFELASIWRLARDGEYAPWLKSLGLSSVQITLFGGEEKTDFFTGRKGAFHDIVKAIDVLIANHIEPTFQIFIYKTNVSDLEHIVPLLMKTEQKLGKPLKCFIKTADPMGAGFKNESIRVERADLTKIPQYIIDKTLVKEGVSDINSLWKTEKELLPDLLNDETPPNDTPDLLALMVSNEFNVYPNSGEMLDYANLGNLVTDGIDVVMDNFINRKTHSLKMNYETPVNYFAKKYGDKNSETLTSRYELCKKWLHMEAENVCLQKEL